MECFIFDSNQVALSLEQNVDTINADWGSYLIEHLVKRNEMNYTPTTFLTPAIGIYAPLSTDYHRAIIMGTFLRHRVSERGFLVAPVAVETTREKVVYPITEEGEIVLSDRTYVGVYVDISPSGTTKRILRGDIFKRFPGRVINEPHIPG